MSSRTLRQRAAELLEPRHLLAGLVKVAFVEGNLMVAGDGAANSFSIVAVADQTGEKSSIAIIPDETTAINDLPAGESLTLPADRLKNVRILPGGGDDQVGVRGLTIEGGLRIDNRGGNDSYQVADSDFGLYLKMESSSARSKATLSDIVIRKTIDKSSPVLFARSLSGQNIDLKATDLKVGGSMDWELNDSPGQVDLSRVEIDGRLSVVSTDALSDLTIEESTLGRAYDKASVMLATKVTKSKNMNVSVSQTQANGGMAIEFLKLGDGRGSAGGGGGQGKVIMQDVHVEGRLGISSAGLPLAVTTTSSAASDYLLELDGVKGESADSKHKNEIHIESFSWGSSLRVEAEGPTALTMKKSSGDEAYLKIKLQDILISSYSISGSKIDGGLKVESIGGTLNGVIEDTTVGESASFNYTKIKFFAPTSSTKEKGLLDLRQFDIGGRLKVESNGVPLDVAATGGTAASVDMFIKLDGVKGESKPQIELADLRIDGGISVVGSGAPLDISVEGTIAKAAYLKMGDIKGNAASGGGGGAGKVIIHDSKLERRLSIEGTALDVTTTASAAGEFLLKLGDIKGESGDSKHKNEIHIESFSWGSSLRVEAEGPTALTMKKSNGDEAYMKIKLQDILISSYSISGSKIDGGLKVESIGGTLNGLIEDTTVGESASFNYTKIKFFAPTSSTKEKGLLDLRQFDIGGRLKVESSGVPLDVAANGGTAAAVDMFLKLDGIKGESKSQVQLADMKIAGGLSVIGDGALDVSIQKTTARAGYLKLGDIKGESLDDKHKNEIDIESFSWGNSLRVEATGPTALTMKKSGGGEAYLKIKMEDVLVSSFNISGSQFDGGLKVETVGGTIQGVIEDSKTTENLSINFSKFEIKYNQQKENSSLRLQELDIGGGLQIESNGPLDVSGNKLTAGANLYLKMSGAEPHKGTAPGSSQINFSDVQLGGGLAILGGFGSESVRVERLRSAQRAVIQLGGGSDTLAVLDSVFAGPALFDGGEGDDMLTLSNNTFDQGKTLLNWEKIDEPGGPILTAGAATSGPLLPNPPLLSQGRAGPGKR